MARMKELLGRVIAWALALKPVRAFLLYSEQKGALLASAVTYRALFSIFAAVLLGFSIAAIWLAGRPDLWQALIDALDNAIPGLVGDGDGALIRPEALMEPAQFTLAGIIAVVALLSAAIGAIGALREAIRTMAGTTHTTVPVILLMVRDLLFAAIMGGVFFAAALATFLGSAFVSTVIEWIGVAETGLATVATRLVAVAVTLALDTVLIVVMFLLLSGVRPSARALWSGGLLGGIGLTALQQLSGLFVGGAPSNPLLASSASIIALLLWVNLSAQVILIACAYIVTGVEEDRDRVGARFGAGTFAQRRLHRAEHDVELAVKELDEARAAEEKERADAKAT